MKVKVKLGHFAEEDSRDKLLKDSRECHDDFKQILTPFLLCMASGVIIAVILLISSFFGIDGTTIIVGFMAIIFLMVMGLIVLISGMLSLIRGKYYSIIAYLKKIEDEVKK